MVTPSLATRSALDRVLKPDTVAIVGVRDGSPYLEAVRRTLVHSDVEIYIVNPRHPEVDGRPTYASLADIPVPIDALYLATNAARSVEYAESAVGLDIGGLVVVAGGFGEVGPAGGELQRRLVTAAEAGGFAVIGPNCLGMINVPRQISLAIAADHQRRPGGISVVSQSGALINGVSMAAWERRSIGLNLLVSAGNEAFTDLADYVDYLADDPDTTAIGLVIEKVRRPKQFFSAIRRALSQGKPVVAIKLARSERTRELAASHTGALTGDAWTYEVALRQAGVDLAYDCDELIDRLAVLEQLGTEYRRKIQGLAVLSFTGGFASLTADLAGDLGFTLPALDDFRPWLAENLQGSSVPNPLDATGFGITVWPQIIDMYMSSADIDACIFVHPLSDADEAGGRHALETFVAGAQKYGKPAFVTSCAGPLGQWAQDLVATNPAVAAGWGPRQTLQGMATLGQFAARAGRATQQEHTVHLIPRPDGTPVIERGSHMLSFADASELFDRQSIPVAPFRVIGEAQRDADLTFAGPYVVKLADVAHRSDHGAVLLNINSDGLTEAIGKMRHLADAENLPTTVAVQPMVPSHGEAFVGVQSTELGPLVVFGLGGIFVEVLKRVGGLLAPFDRRDALELLAEFDDVEIMHGLRGRKPWDLETLADILVRVGDLAAGSTEWLDSLDINPLLVTDDGFAAVDALCFVRPATSNDERTSTAVSS